WGRHDPIGRAIKLGDARSNQPWHRVVGVAGDQRDTFAIRRVDPYANYSMREVYRVIKPTDSIAINDRQVAAFARAGMRPPPLSMSFHVRVRGNTELAAIRIQRALRAIAAEGYEPTVIPQVEALGVAGRRAMADFAASLFSTFAFIGLGLVAIGVFGIVSHSVEERRRELAVRISLGATGRNILHSVLREGNALILAGIAMGLLFAKYSVWWLGGFIPEAYGYDALFFAFIASLLFGLAAFAAFIPAFRATRIDPVEALRHE
ncbi:MAG: FtsX-like permease family protein, partial [Gemmatimonadaceae bacterium]